MYISYADLFINEDKSMIFDLNNYAIYEATKDFVERLVRGKEYLTFDDQVMIDDLKKEKVLRCQKNNKGIHSVKIHVSNCCNLSCKYCYANQGNYGVQNDIMSIETADMVIQFIRKMKEDNNKVDMVTFFGGEPFLAPDIIERICEKLEDIIHNFQIQTNGTLINDRIIAIIKRFHIHITVSIDGPKELHDYNRISSGDIGTFDIVERNIDILKRAGINIVGIQATLTKEFCYRYSKTDIADFLFKKYKVPFIKVEYNKNDNIKDTYEREVEDYFERLIKGEYILDCETNRFMKRMLSKSYVDYFCEAGRGLISISSKGKIFPCQIFLNKEEYGLGDVQKYEKNMFGKEGKIAKKSQFEKCNNCIVKYYCSTCGENGKEEEECKIFREKTIKILNFLFQLLKEDKMMDMLNNYRKFMCFMDSN